ncbi:MAG TPA: hypothetical protein P5096_01790 [Patescibacteria group bacterium]|nr:hypothetical protein [Patescibacteria group bacterium]
MSKKNKALKQLIKSQIQSGTQGVSGVGAPTGFASTFSAATTATKPITISDKEVSEFALIKKDIRLSLTLIISVIVMFIIIYFIDRQTGFLLSIATKLFNILQNVK